MEAGGPIGSRPASRSRVGEGGYDGPGPSTGRLMGTDHRVLSPTVQLSKWKRDVSNARTIPSEQGPGWPGLEQDRDRDAA